MLTKRIALGVLAFGLSLTAGLATMAQPPAGAARGGPPAAPAAPPAPPSGAIVTTKSGQVQGVLADGVNSFKGIPFAAPPVGDLRWKAPQPTASWKGVRIANAPGPECGRQEDCLYINVYIPEGTKPGAKLPVMYWIYGGGFTGGAGIGGFGVSHDGLQFAKKGVILVTENYRLGRAGWFAHPALTKEAGKAPTGNFGIMDQIAGLKWVQQNINAFGGNPKDVTIFGESAGGISSLFLMLDPNAKGLFGKVIAESSFPRAVGTPLAVAEAYGTRAATANNIKGDGPEALAALRKLPLSAFPASTGTDDPQRAFPIADGKDIKWGIAEGFAGNHELKIPLIIGGNSNEASYFRPQAADLDKRTDRRDALMAAFDPKKTGNKAQIINDLVTVEKMTEPDRNLARAHAKNGNPTWQYYFTVITPAQRGRSMGAAHLAEVRYVFGTLGATPDPTDLATSQAVNAAWTAFAKYGTPGAAAGIDWPKFDPKGEQTLEFAIDGQHIREHVLAAQSDYVEQALK
ncbi:carboxylesterase family protein [soil metagenome]